MGVAAILAGAGRATSAAAVLASGSGSTPTTDTTRTASGPAGLCERHKGCAGGTCLFVNITGAFRARPKRKSRAPSLRKGPRARLSTLPRVKLDLETLLASRHVEQRYTWSAGSGKNYVRRNVVRKR